MNILKSLKHHILASGPQFLNATFPTRRKHDIVESGSQTWLNIGVIWRAVTNTVARALWQVLLISLVWGSARAWRFFLTSSRGFWCAVQTENMGSQNVLKLESRALGPDLSSSNDKQRVQLLWTAVFPCVKWRQKYLPWISHRLLRELSKIMSVNIPCKLYALHRHHHHH